MTTANKIKINKEIYIWAIEESRKDLGEIKNRFEKIEKWISQEDYPTFRQVENLANYETGKIFTLIHEYIHFLLQEDDIFVDIDKTIENNLAIILVMELACHRLTLDGCGDGCSIPRIL